MTGLSTCVRSAVSALLGRAALTRASSMKDLFRAVGAVTIAITLVSASIAPVSAAPWDFLDGTFGNDGDGSGSIEEHNDRFYYTGQHGVDGHKPHEVWIYPYSLFTEKKRPREDDQSARAHIAWCSDHYRTYRRSDNSFQPQRGEREECRSPYWH